LQDFDIVKGFDV